MWHFALMPGAEKQKFSCWLHGHPVPKDLILRHSCGALIFRDSAPLSFREENQQYLKKMYLYMSWSQGDQMSL
jgi:hypothetical protein